MDGERFDRLARGLGAGVSRRRVLRAALGAALGGLLGAAGARGAAAACLANGTRCGREGDGACCSGVCKRKRGTTKKFCRRAPNQGTCTTERDRCAGDAAVCGTDQGFDCRCYVTTAGRSLCGRLQFYCLAGGACATDADCDVVGQEAVCVRGGESCGDDPTCANICVVPCPNPA